MDRAKGMRADAKRGMAHTWSFYRSPQAALAQASGGALPQYDVILTSETLYEPSNYPALVALLAHLLRPGIGVAYVAARPLCHGHVH